MTRAAAARAAVLKTVLKRLGREEYKIPPKPDSMSALERVLALILMGQGGSYATSDRAVKVLLRRFAHWNEVRVARRFEVKDALQRGRVSQAGPRAEAAQEFLRRVFGLQNHLELDWLYDATSERREKLLVALTMTGPYVGPALDLDAAETEGPQVTTNLRRLCSRLGLVPSNPKDQEVAALVGPELTGKSLYPNTIALEAHARTICDSKHPHCRQCVLLDLCPHGKRALGSTSYRNALAELGLGSRGGSQGRKKAGRASGGRAVRTRSR
ncbi:MAG: hypothetical protein ACE5H3_10035 [Planctomycetota bacterium]